MPPAADVMLIGEPEYPIAALTDPKAEDAWHDRVLIWGRTGWAQNRRVCQWAVDLGLKVPKDYCAVPAPVAAPK